MEKIHQLIVCALAPSSNIPAHDERGFVVGPDYSGAPETTVRPRVPMGDIRECTIDSKDRNIYQTKTPHDAWKYHENLIRRAVKKPIRFWLQVKGWDRDDTSYHNWVRANRLMAQELKAIGYDYRYVFSNNAGQTDGKVTRETLPAALEWLWEGYRAK